MKKILLVLVLFLMTSPACADTIVLKTGQVLEANIVERDDKKIKVEFEGIPMDYYLEGIESINGEKLVPQVKAVTTDAKEILKRSREAERAFRTSGGESTLELEMPGMMSLVSADSVAIDAPGRKMKTTRQMKKMDMALGKQLSAIARNKIDKLKAQGADKEKIKQLEKNLELVSSMLQGSMQGMIDKLKSVVVTTYLIDKTAYMNASGKWVKFEHPSLSAVWDILNLDPEKSADKDYVNNANIPGTYKDMILASSSMMGEGDAFEVAEENYMGKDCYVLTLKDPKKMIEQVRNSISSMQDSTSPTGRAKVDPESIIIDNLTFKRYILKDSFLPFSQLMSAEATNLMDEQGMAPGIKGVKIFFKTEKLFHYPAGEVILPQEASGAQQVSNTDEAYKVLFKDLISQEGFFKQ